MLHYKVDNLSIYTKKQFENMLTSLSPSRLEKVRTYKGEHFKQSLLASYDMEAVLCMLCGYRVGDIVYEYSDDGKPSINGDCYISMSHSKDKVAFAVSDKSIGIDIETAREVNKEVLSGSRFLSQEEKLWIRANTTRFLYLWTFKEALCKASGISLLEVLDGADCPLVDEHMSVVTDLKAATGDEKLTYEVRYAGVDYEITQFIEEECVVCMCIAKE